MRWLRLLFAGVAAVAVVAAIVAQSNGAPRVGELWFRFDAFSLNLVQAVTQRYLHPALWDRVAVPLLLSPVASVAAVTAGIFALLAWLVHPRHRPDLLRRRESSLQDHEPDDRRDDGR